MTIAKKAVSNFLNRELDDWTFLKHWRRRDLLKELRQLPMRPHITSPYKHWDHQLVGLLLCCLLDSFLLFLDVGSGKTRVLLEAFAYRRRRGQASRALIVVLNDVNAFSWEDEVAEHTPQFKAAVLIGSGVARWKLLQTSDAHIFIISFAGLRAMLSKKTVNKKKATEANQTAVKKLCRIVDWVAYDEIHKCKNHKSLTYSICKGISKWVQYRYGATGTAFGRNPEDLWAEFLIVDKGETLGTTLGLFRAGFFNEKRGFGGWKEWSFDKRLRKLFRKTLRNRSLYYSDNEIGDMPRRKKQTILLRPPKELSKFYNEALESLQNAARDEELENNWVRLRMICSGFVSYTGEDNDKIRVELPNNPKLGALEEFVEQVPLDWKGIIVHEFVYSGLIVERVLKELGYAFFSLNGSVSPADKKEVYRAFRKEPDCRFLVMNWRSGGAGGNYQIAPYMHFYESPVSPIERKQVEGRIRRRNSKVGRVHYTDPIIKGSVEEDILGFLKEGRNLYKELMQSGKRRRTVRKI